MNMRELPGLPGYWAGEDGRIYSTRLVSSKPDPYGASARALASAKAKYLTVGVETPDGRVRKPIHTLVCRAWHGEPPTPAHQVSHLNEQAHDNRPSNLAWETARENMARRGYSQFSGEKHPRARLTDAQIAEVRAMLAEGSSLSEIGRQYGISPRYVGYLRDGVRRRKP